MIDKSTLILGGIICESLVVMTLMQQSVPAVAQAPVNATVAAGSGTSPQSINPDRIVPDYPIRYGAPTVEPIREVLNRIHAYLEGCTPPKLVNIKTNEAVTDLRTISGDVFFERGSFPIVSYEWGVTYSGMLLASEMTGDNRFADYVAKRLNFLAELFPICQAQMQANPKLRTPIGSVVNPGSLDDSGSMCAAMIKARRAGVAPGVQPMIDNYIRYISKGQQRLDDGTLSRNRPFPDSLWLDDLYMKVGESRIEQICVS